jgi:molybdopterin adenylyltransferase
MINDFVVITISDKSSTGERIDTSGPAIRRILSEAGMNELAYEVIPDEFDQIRKRLKHFSDEVSVALVVTTGGTGFSPRDVTPEATRAVIDREAPGLAEAMRQKSLAITSHAMLSRAVAGIRKSTLIVNLPGSEKAVVECLGVILPALPHALDLLADREIGSHAP